MDSSKTVVIGKFGSPHGVKGWIKVNSFAEPYENILNYSPWLIETKDGWQAIEYAQSAVHAKGVVVKLPSCDDRDAAALLTNSKLAIYSHQLAKLPIDEYYWRDLEGLTVEDLAGNELGVIDYLHETGSNDVMVVKRAKKQFLIPYLPDDIVHKVNLAEKRMVVDWDPEF